MKKNRFRQLIISWFVFFQLIFPLYQGQQALAKNFSPKEMTKLTEDHSKNEDILSYLQPLDQLNWEQGLEEATSVEESQTETEDVQVEEQEVDIPNYSKEERMGLPTIYAVIEEEGVALRRVEEEADLLTLEQSYLKPLDIRIQLDNLQVGEEASWVILDLPIGMMLTTSLEMLQKNYQFIEEIDATEFNQETLDTHQPNSGRLAIKINNEWGSVGFNLAIQPDSMIWDTTDDEPLTSHHPAIKITLQQQEITDIVQLDQVYIKEKVTNRGVVLYRDEELSSTTLDSPVLGDNQYCIQLRTPIGTNKQLYSYSAYKAEVYVPYVVLDSNQYLSAELDEQRLNDWCERNPHVTYEINQQEDGRIRLIFTFKQQVYHMRKAIMLYFKLNETDFGKYLEKENALKYTSVPMFYRKNYYQTDFIQYTYGMNPNLITEPGTTQKTISDIRPILNLGRANGSDIGYIYNETAFSQLGFFGLKNTGPGDTKAKLTFEFNANEALSEASIGVTTVRMFAEISQQNYQVTCSMFDRRTGEELEETTLNVTQEDLSTGSRFNPYRALLTRSFVLEKLGIDASQWEYYFFKQVSYQLTMPGSYEGGNPASSKATGGNFYGQALIPFAESQQAMKTVFTLSEYEGEITGDFKEVVTEDDQVAYQKNITSEIISNEELTSSYYLNNLIISQNQDEGTKKVEDGDTINSDTRLNISAESIMSSYPYSHINYLEHPIFLIRVPKGMELILNSVQVRRGGRGIPFTIDYQEKRVLKDGSYLYKVQVDNDTGFGYYKENLTAVQSNISIQYKLDIKEYSPNQIVKFDELLFITHEYIKGYYRSERDRSYIIDQWGVADFMEDYGYSLGYDNNQYYLPSNSSTASFQVAGKSRLLQTKLERKLTNESASKWSDSEEPLVITDLEEGQIDYRVTVENPYVSGQVEQTGFYYYLPVPKKDMNNNWMDDPLSFSLSLTGAVKLSGLNGEDFECFYTTKTSDFDNQQANAEEKDGYYSKERFQELSFNWKDVTMVKVLLKPEHRIKGTMTLYLTSQLMLDFSSQEEMHRFAGEKINWTAYGSQRYLDDELINQISQKTNPVGLRIKYVDSREFDLTAYKGDTLPEGFEGSKIYTLTDLPIFVGSHDLKISAVKTNNVILVAEDFFDEETSALVSNSAFYVGVSGRTTSEESLSQLKEGEETLIDSVSGDESPRLRFRVHNGDYLTNSLTERYLTMKVKAQDDIELKIKINIRRIVTVVGHDVGLESGKHFTPFLPKSKVAITQNSAVSGQAMLSYAWDDFSVPTLMCDPPLPKGASVTVKLVETEDDTPVTSPVYGYYTVPLFNEHPIKEIPLSLLKNIQTGAPLLDPLWTGDKVVDRGFMIVVDFQKVPESAYLPVGTMIKMSLIAKSKHPSIEDIYLLMGNIQMAEKRVFSMEQGIDMGQQYSQTEPIPLQFTAKADHVLGRDGCDNFNFEKKMHAQVQLCRDDQPVKLPEGAVLVSKEDQVYPVSYRQDSFIIPNMIDINANFEVERGYFDGKLVTQYDPLPEGEYTWKVTLYNYHDSNHPLAGDCVDVWKSKKFQFVSEPDNYGLRVYSKSNDERIIYTNAKQQTLPLSLDFKHISKIQMSLYQVGDMEEEWNHMIETSNQLTFDDSATHKHIELVIQDNLSSKQKGEYEIIFQVTPQKGEDFQVYYHFLIDDQ